MSSATLSSVSSAALRGQDLNKDIMYETFQTWALQNYGDSGKTKTVTRKKYTRIVHILAGEEPPTAENSKFRFWVKAKGFRLGPIPGNGVSYNNAEKVLYVPSRVQNDPLCSDAERDYKKVAVVEDFFDIIYSVHVEMDGRGGKHAGQKRTYRAIAETYSFLPREAVTRFLMSCADCQKRMHLSFEHNNNTTCATNQNGSSTISPSHVTDDPPMIDFSLPITQTYLNHMRNKGYASDFSCHDEESMSSADSELSREPSPSPSPQADNTLNGPNAISRKDTEGDIVMTPVNLATPPGPETGSADEDRPTAVAKSPVPSEKESRGHPERKRRASNESSDSVVTKTSDGANTDDLHVGKDEEDDNDDEDEEKVAAAHNYDPERLKAFNMFVRLFVDENLDRSVPISKQPKDKIQAILEACDRQFPEFHERSRKRIRTYLKSCRRMRRSKEQNGWEPQLRPTPPHLTSAAAESLLATACENESQNAKRMRMGLDPLPASAMQPSVNPSPQSSQPQVTSQPNTPNNQSQAAQIDRHVPASNDFLRHQPPPPAFRAPPEFHPPFFTNGNGLFRPGFPAGYQHPAHHHPPVIQHSIQTNAVQNGEFGPTDLSMKKQNSKNQLSTTEVATIKQLIAGYRESAAFLYRSADELEQLLLQQN
ncbi:nucleolar protein 4-like isoform X1 [Haliotis rufescens]|uniref:nucleolar protein 4-like isoform X1 n=1 Tax=Haliotis rufescens TaxID=6454 RepID=UPI001EAFD0E6|nr:nucleolar protein 4-like isoform X1 [Haliotis rufescens]